MANVLAYGDKLIGTAGGSGGSGGHEILDASGTSLPQEEKLQFTGTLKTTDDSTNGKTVVSDAAEEVEWSVWDAMTEQERTAYAAGKKIDIINVPGADGSIRADLMTKLWENPDPSSSFVSQDITLSSSSYDLYMIEFKSSIDSAMTSTTIIVKDAVSKLELPSGSASGVFLAERNLQHFSSLSKISFNYAYVTVGASYGVDERYCIPTTIYGIKKSINLTFSALAPNVSTSANKCMMSDGVTNVEDALTATDFFSSITTESGVTLREGYAKSINGVKYIYLRFEISSGITGRTLIGNLPNGIRPSAIIRTISSCASIYNYPLDMVTNTFIATDGSIYAGDYISPAGTAIKEVNIIVSYI